MANTSARTIGKALIEGSNGTGEIIEFRIHGRGGRVQAHRNNQNTHDLHQRDFRREYNASLVC